MSGFTTIQSGFDVSDTAQGGVVEVFDELDATL